jgi:DNA helicase-2/ATP-dependent DNA helicase PcrA
VYGNISFFERKEIKDALAYLRLAEYGDDLSFKRIINVPRRQMGKQKMAFLAEKAESENITLLEALGKYAGESIFKGTGIIKFLNALLTAKETKDTQTVSEVFHRLLLDSGYEDYIRKSGEMERLDNLAEFMRAVAAMESEHGGVMTVGDFLREVSLSKEMEENEDKKDKVRIMTAHISKGLEFHTVIMAGMSEKTFPSARTLEEKRQYDTLEEERRLCYVAMTRAKKRLVMTESEGVGFRGLVKTPSRFLFDIDDGCIERIGAISPLIMEEFAKQIVDDKSLQQYNVKVGDRVRHKIFGEGVVEVINAKTKTYSVRFVSGTKPIRFDYQGLTMI